MKKQRLYPPGQMPINKVVHKTERLKKDIHLGAGGGSPRYLDQSILGLRKSFCAKDEVDSGLQYCGVFGELQIFVSIE